MSRDQRCADNWALLHACEEALRTQSPVVVAYSLASPPCPPLPPWLLPGLALLRHLTTRLRQVPDYLGATARHNGFLLRGLRLLEPALAALGIPFFLLEGDPGATIPPLAARLKAGLLVTDFCPLREHRAWREAVAAAVSCPVHEVRPTPPRRAGYLSTRQLPAKAQCGAHAQVDAHNIVPVWEASPKLEYAARTIRPKIHAKLPSFLKEFPPVPPLPPFDGEPPTPPGWDALLARVLEAGKAVPEVAAFQPGEAAALAALVGATGEGGFLGARLKLYESRNDPNQPEAQSGLSPWLNFGQLSAQRVALEARKHAKAAPKAVESFLEELIVRRELSDNFCLHNPRYDSLTGASQWAADSLAAHRGDVREHVYTRAQFEAGETHDELWNAAQGEAVKLGKMHGFMRMYWAKKILEWSASPEEALATALYLNDRYNLDGRDPNGMVGVMWSIAGIHDMGWTERPVFGKIRFMNYAGCKRKFNIPNYVARIAGGGTAAVSGAGGNSRSAGKKKGATSSSTTTTKKSTTAAAKK